MPKNNKDKRNSRPLSERSRKMRPMESMGRRGAKPEKNVYHLDCMDVAEVQQLLPRGHRIRNKKAKRRARIHSVRQEFRQDARKEASLFMLQRCA